MKERILKYKTPHGVEKIPENLVVKENIHNKLGADKFLGDTKGDKTPPRSTSEIKPGFEKIYMVRGEKIPPEEFKRKYGHL